MLPDTRKNTKDITRLAEAKVIDYAYDFAISNVRAILSCDVCNEPRCIYSKKAAGKPNSAGKFQSCVLDQWTESGYVRVNEVIV